VRILLLTQIVPYPLDSGPKIKTHYVLRYLSSRHDVHLVSFVRSAEEVTAARTLAEYCASVTTVPLRRSRRHDAQAVVRSFQSKRPVLVERDDTAAMRTAISALVARTQVDAVHADQLTMGQFAVDFPARLRVLDEHNAVWTIVHRAAKREPWGPRRLLAEREWRLLRAYEGNLCRRFDTVTVVSPDDQYWLEAAARGTFRSLLAPIAVDTDAMPYRSRPVNGRQILSVATMYYPPNPEGVEWFSREIYPIIRRKIPDVRFVIVGSRPPASIRRLATPTSGISVTGYVDDLTPIVDASSILVVPLHSGSGMRVKILEAFARGIPVVSTTVGMGGIDVRPDKHLLVADQPSAFASAVSMLLTDEERAERIARSARSLVESRYDWRVALAPLDSLYPARR
jgi:polysaccharide biosynthesis protein PslH